MIRLKSRCRGLIVAAVIATGCAQAADGPVAWTAVKTLASSGAVQLALQRIDVLQPQQPVPPADRSAGASGWRDWERLRLELLAATGQHEAVLRRAADWRGAAADPVLHEMAARAALELGRGAVARYHARLALWSPGMTEPRLRELRLVVIRSLVADRLAEEALRSMLRFQQDYRGLDGAVAALFVDGLLDLGRAAEAVQWLGSLEERGPVRLRLRLHSGVVSAAEAAAQARAALNRSDDAAWWHLLAEAAQRLPSTLLGLEAAEAALQRAREDQASVAARSLWQAYAEHARSAANSHQLLAGDEAGWLGFARQRLQSAPVLARAYLALLAREAGSDALRRDAQTALVASLADSGLPRVALRLFQGGNAGPELQGAEARLVLAVLAENAGDHASALAWRRGLPAPPGTSPELWGLRLGATALRAGRPDEAALIARQLGTATVTMAAEWMQLLQQCADHGALEAGQALADRLLPQADAAQARRILGILAAGYARVNQPQAAAEHYLHAAARAEDAAAGAWARLEAGLQLARAGLRADARAQFEWLLRHARDPALIAQARRELGF